MEGLLEIFRIPSKIFLILLNGLYSILTGKDSSLPNDYPKYMDVISLFVWIYLAYSVYGYLAYNNVYYVFACKDNSSKCYSVRGEYVEPECDSYDDYSSCSDPSFSAIYFDNGGYLELDCTKYDDSWDCDALNDDSKWTLKIDEIKKVKK